MIRFESDYTEGACPEIIDALVKTNEEQTVGYGEDAHCEHARALIKEACKAPFADVHFLVGGTQTNTTVIASVLLPYEGVLSAESGHINVHESGAIEATGHKVLALKSGDGKINARQISEAYLSHINDANHEHMVRPGMVYISNPTENGTIYKKSELTEISRVCRKYGLVLFLDGARLGYGLCAKGGDLTLPDIAKLCDVFYIGGTKVGALFGEAVVITCDALKKNFRYHIKQRGGMLAKGRLLGVQFETLFTDNLYFRISKHAIDMADMLKKGFAKRGYKFLYQSPTNQQYPILPNALLKKLSRKYGYSFWEKVDGNNSAVRFCTSFMTKREHIEQLFADIDK